MISATNATVHNLIGRSDDFISRFEDDNKKWVKVITKLPFATFRSLGAGVSFKDSRSNDRLLGEFLSENGIEFRTGDIIDSIMGQMSSDNKIKFVALLEFILRQSKSCLAGISVLTLDKFFKILPEFVDVPDIDPRDIWVKMINVMTKSLLTRKPQIAQEIGHMSSLHAVSTEDDISSDYKGEEEVDRVDNHFYFYGKRSDSPIFDLSIRMPRKPSEESHLVRLDTRFVDRCYFPLLHEDLMLFFCCFNVWVLIWPEITIAKLYQNELYRSPRRRSVNQAKFPDSFALEQLAQFSICFASHSSLTGFTPGKKAIEEFVKNVQVSIPDGEFPFPTSLSNYLDNIDLPYLFESNSLTNAVISELAPYVRTGKSARLKNKEGVDVGFDIFHNNIPSRAYIECKMLDESVGINELLHYYNIACKVNCKLFILLAKKIQVSMKGPLAVPERFDPKPEEPEETQSEKDGLESEKSGKKIKKDASLKAFQSLWLEERNHINMYSYNLIHSESESESESGETFSFQVAALKEFNDPKGVFILVESTFRPPRLQ